MAERDTHRRGDRHGDAHRQPGKRRRDYALVIDIGNFKLYNSAAFGGLPFVDMPEFHMEYDPAALMAGRLHIKLLRLNLAEVDLVRNAAGQTNLTALQTKMQPSGKSRRTGGGQ